MKFDVRVLSASWILAIIAVLAITAEAAKDNGYKVPLSEIKLIRAGKSSNTGLKTLTLFPQNVAALVGETVYLSCEALEPPPVSRILWTEYVTSGLGSIISDNGLIQNHPNRDRYSIIQATPTEFYLEIRDLRLSDGGTYACQDALGGLPQDNIGEADLIVIAANPNCTNTIPIDGVVVEGNSNTLECVLFFQGGISPIMTWSGPPPFVTGGASNPDNVWSGLQFIVDRSQDIRAFECLTNFTTLPGTPAGVASNVPTWNYLYRAQQLFVFWGPKNLAIIPIQPEYAVGDTIGCFADAFPLADYTWQNLRTTQTTNGQYFEILPELAGTNQTMRCTAVNTIQGFRYSNNVFGVVYVPIQTSSTSTPSTTAPTTPPFNAPCNDLSGIWRSTNPVAELGLTVYDQGQIGEIFGLLKNGTDDYRVEVIGTVDLEEFSLVGLSAIWPSSLGVFGFSGECHRCSGVEVLFFGNIQRSILDSSGCGDGGSPALQGGYTFYRSDSSMADAYKEPIKVYKPTNVSKRLGVKLVKY